MELIDTHAHLNFEKFDDDRERVIKQAKEKLKAVIDSGSKLLTNQDSLDLSRDHEDFIFSTLGFHPIFKDQEIEQVKQQIRENRGDVIAIGEIGLDYYHDREEEDRKLQEEKFMEMLDLAEELGKTVVIHSRDAEKRALKVLDEYNLNQVVMHCFNGSVEQAEEAVDRGYFVSISTQVLYSDLVQKLAKKIPLEAILLETDSPYLYKDGKNYPWHVKESLEKISQLRMISKDKIARQVYNNSLTAFPDLSTSL